MVHCRKERCKHVLLKFKMNELIYCSNIGSTGRWLYNYFFFVHKAKYLDFALFKIDFQVCEDK